MSQKRGYLLPETINPPGRVCVKLSIPDDDRHIMAFMGALTELSKWFNWETTGDNKGKQVADVWRVVLEDIIWECGMIEDIRIVGCDLQAKRDGVWVSIGSLLDSIGVSAGALPNTSQPSAEVQGCTIHFGIPAGATGPAGSPGPTGPIGSSGFLQLPTPDDIDKLCYAATEMGRLVADDFQDFLQQIQFANTIIFGTAENFAERVSSVLPEILTAGADELVTFGLQVTYNVTEATLEFLVDNLSDLDVQRRINEFIFCALKRSLVVNNEGVTELVNFENNLISELGAAYYEFTFISVAEDLGEVEFGDIGAYIQIVIDQLIEAPTIFVDAVAGLAVSFALVQNLVINAALGDVRNSWKAIFATLAARAEFFDDRDCASFDCIEYWCYEWDFTIGDGGWQNLGYLGNTTDWGAVWSLGGWQRAPNQLMAMTFVMPPADPGTKITEVYWEGMGAGLNFPGSGANQPSMQAQIVNWDWVQGNYQVAYGVEQSTFSVTKIRIKGTGTMPNLTGGAVCP